MPQVRLAEWVKLLKKNSFALDQQLSQVLETLAKSANVRRIALELGESKGKLHKIEWEGEPGQKDGNAGVRKGARVLVPGSIKTAATARRLKRTSHCASSRRSVFDNPSHVRAYLRFYWQPTKNPATARIQENVCIDLLHHFLKWERLPAQTDPSTGLPNHVQLNNDLVHLVEQDPQTQGSLILVELIDHEVVRRMFNGAGSAAVDGLLLDIATKLKALLAGPSCLYYVGVGRFAIVAHRTGADLHGLMGGITSLLKLPFESGSLRVHLQAILGFVPLNQTLENPGDALRKATVSAEHAKSLKLPRPLYDPEYDQRQIRSYGLIQDIPRAIQNGEFFLAFQPKLKVATDTFESVEALLRWRHPVFGNVSPAEFIPLAENTELIHAITRWVFSACLQTLQKLRKRGLTTSVALNISAHNLGDATFTTFLAEALREHDVSPAFIQIECTEYSAIASPACTENLREISRMGFAVALDDFGSGYSNLSCLNTLPINYLKIDRSLVWQAGTDLRSLELLDGVVKLGKSLGYQIVIEGVEDEVTAGLVKALNVDEIQGYFYSRPLPYPQMVEFIESHNAKKVAGFADSIF